MKLRVTDTETTGLEPESNGIIEMAGVNLIVDSQVDGIIDWCIGFSATSFCQPGYEISFGAMATHHIMPEDLKDAPPPATASAYLDEHLGEPDFWVAHNAPFDRSFFVMVNQKYGDVKRWLDTYRIAKHIWPDAPGYSNQVLRYWLGIGRNLEIPDHLTAEEVAPHRALFDCFVTIEILKIMLKDRTVEELYALSDPSKPILMKVCPLKKYKGMEFKNVPRDYLQWVVKQSDMDSDIRHSAMHWLNNQPSMI
jgi:exodeoxyribonuclease X